MIEADRALSSDDPEERRRGVADIARAPEAEQPRLLLLALGDANWRVRKEAVGVAPSLGASRQVVDALVRVFEPGDNVGLRNAAVEALGGLGSLAVEALEGALPGLDADGRKLAIEALGRSGDSTAISVIEPRLTDEDANVRAAAIEGISALGTADIDRAASLLERCLATDQTLEVLAALEGLNRLSVPVSFPVLRLHLKDPLLRDAALIAAGISAQTEAAPYLVRAVGSSEGRTFHIALRALAQFIAKTPEAARAARVALSSLGDAPRRRLVDVVRAATDDLDLRRRHILVAGALGTAEAADAVIDALADDLVAAEAERALEMLGPAAFLALARRARTGPAHERAASVEQLGRLADESTRAIAIQAIFEATHDGAPEVVRPALGALAQFGDERTFGLAARWMSAESPTAVRQAAVAALGVVSVRHPEGARALARDVRPDGPDAAVAAVVIGALPLPVLGTVTDDVVFLADVASNQSAVARRAALDALSRFSSPSAVEAVSFAITDETQEVQLAAVRSLGRMRDEQGRAVGVSRLLEVVRTFDVDAVNVAAIGALGEANDSSALDVLRIVARGSAAMRAVAAVEAIGRIDGHGRVDALIHALSHEETEVVKAALRALANEDMDARTTAHLAACLDHELWDVRRLAAELLGRRSDAKNLLRQRLVLEREPLVREEIQRSLTESDGMTARRSVPPLGGGRA